MVIKLDHPEKRDFVSIVAPFGNEGEGVDGFYHALLPVLARTPRVRFEVVCVAAGCHDETLARLVRLVKLDARFTVVELSRQFGREAALSAGMDSASGAAVIPVDACLPDSPELIPRLIGEWQKGADVVLVRREDPGSDSSAQRRAAEWLQQIQNRLLDVKIPENVGEFRLMDHSVIAALKQLPEPQRLMNSLFPWVGLNTSTVSYIRRVRSSDATKPSGWRAWNLAMEGLASRHNTAPLKVWTYVGGVGAILTFIYATYVIFRTLIRGIDVPGYASLLVVVLFFASLQLISIGLLGEYIGRIYLEIKRRPTYLVRRCHGQRDER